MTHSSLRSLLLLQVSVGLVAAAGVSVAFATPDLPPVGAPPAPTPPPAPVVPPAPVEAPPADASAPPPAASPEAVAPPAGGDAGGGRSRRRVRVEGGGEAAPVVPPPQTEVPAPEVPASAPPAEAVAAPAVPGVAVLTLGHGLGEREELTLWGDRPGTTLAFGIPVTWSVTGPVELRLALRRSAVLDPSLSSLTVLLNGAPLGTVRLDGPPDAVATHSIWVPRSALQDYNQIELRAIHRTGARCEDPTDPSLWTAVVAGTALHIPRQTGGVPDLALWPAPFIDLRDPDPASLWLSLGASPGAGEAAALTALAPSLGRSAAYRGLLFRGGSTGLAAAEGPTLLLGQASDLPDLPALLQGEALPGPGQGLILMSVLPQSPEVPLVVVTGGDAAGLLAAASALASPARAPLLRGRLVRVDESPPVQVPPSAHPPVIPADGRAVTLAGLGATQLTLRGRYPTPIQLPLSMDADALADLDGGTLDLGFSYSAQVDPEASAIEVRLNGVPLRSVGLRSIDGADDGRLHVPLPASLLRPGAPLEVRAVLRPIGAGPCTPGIDEDYLWVRLEPGSTLAAPHASSIALPTLKGLQHGGWPFLASPERPVEVRLPEGARPSLWAAGAQVLSWVARGSRADAPLVSLLPAGAGSGAPAAQWVLLGDPAAHPGASAVAEKRLLQQEKGVLAWRGRGVASLRVAGAGPVGWLEAVDLGDGRMALLVQGATDAGLVAVAQALGRPGATVGLRGSVALLTEEGDFRVVGAAPTSTWTDAGPISRVRRAAHDAWWSAALLLLGGGLLTIFLVRRLSARRSGT